MFFRCSDILRRALCNSIPAYWLFFEWPCLKTPISRPDLSIVSSFCIFLFSYWKLIQVSIDTIHYFDILTVHFFSRNKSVFSLFKYNFREVPCNKYQHQKNVGITMTDYLLVFWQISGKGSNNRQNILFSVTLQNFLRGKSSSSCMHSWESLWQTRQTPSVVATNILLHILISKTKTNNEIRFKVVSVDICQKLSNLQKTLTSFAPAYRSRQLLRPGPLFFKSEWYQYIYIWSIFYPFECWSKHSIFQLRFWWLDRN